MCMVSIMVLLDLLMKKLRNSNINSYIDVFVKYRRQKSAIKKPKWESPAKKEEAVKGIYNFNEEVGEIRNFLDLLHSKHEQPNTYEYPPG